MYHCLNAGARTGAPINISQQYEKTANKDDQIIIGCNIYVHPPPNVW